MSDIFLGDIFYDVATPDGSVWVSNDNPGDDMLTKLAARYPSATVVVRERGSQAAIGETCAIEKLIAAKWEWITLPLKGKAP